MGEIICTQEMENQPYLEAVLYKGNLESRLVKEAKCAYNRGEITVSYGVARNHFGLAVHHDQAEALFRSGQYVDIAKTDETYRKEFVAFAGKEPGKGLTYFDECYYGKRGPNFEASAKAQAEDIGELYKAGHIVVKDGVASMSDGSALNDYTARALAITVRDVDIDKTHDAFMKRFNEHLKEKLRGWKTNDPYYHQNGHLVTELERDYFGASGDFFAVRAGMKLNETVADLCEGRYAVKDGIVRYAKLDRPAVDAIAEACFVITDRVDLKKTAEAFEKHQNESLEKYRAQKHPLSDEQKAEMTAAFGPGQTIVNVITGEKYVTGGTEKKHNRGR